MHSSLNHSINPSIHPSITDLFMHCSIHVGISTSCVMPCSPLLAFISCYLISASHPGMCCIIPLTRASQKCLRAITYLMFSPFIAHLMLPYLHISCRHVMHRGIRCPRISHILISSRIACYLIISCMQSTHFGSWIIGSWIKLASVMEAMQAKWLYPSTMTLCATLCAFMQRSTHAGVLNEGPASRVVVGIPSQEHTTLAGRQVRVHNAIFVSHGALTGLCFPSFVD
eukprot:1160532-Pelagomonas_calceolata.AAC.11